jgi:hypothetical protein
MKPFKTLVFAALLVFSLAFDTFAGDIEVPGAPAPPPPSRLTTTYEEPLTTGTTATQDTEVVTSEPSDYLFYEALVALLSVY